MNNKKKKQRSTLPVEKVLKLAEGTHAHLGNLIISSQVIVENLTDEIYKCNTLEDLKKLKKFVEEL